MPKTRRRKSQMTPAFGERIRGRLGELGWSQVELAKRMGVAKKTVGRWCRGQWPQSESDRQKLPGVLEVSYGWLFGTDVKPVKTAVNQTERDRAAMYLAHALRAVYDALRAVSPATADEESRRLVLPPPTRRTQDGPNTGMEDAS